MVDHAADKHGLRALLPLAANGTLTPAQQAQLDAGLLRHPELQHELRWLQTLRETLHAQPLDPVPEGDLGWSAFAQRLPAASPTPRRASPGWAERLRDWLQANTLPVLATACALLVAQAVVIGTLMQPGADYRAAGGPTATQATGVLLHVTVRASVTEPQLREALRRANARIVNGPSALGVYTLRVEAGADGTPRDAQAQRLAQALLADAGAVFDSASPAEGP
ncbi:MAG: hypothetical protein IBJ14_04540 [Hydrogenophaga sp.]|nr:hypothetical protein [Hydrogenophaga sp.]